MVDDALKPMIDGSENPLQIYAVMCCPHNPISLLSEMGLDLETQGYSLTDQFREYAISVAASEHMRGEKAFAAFRNVPEASIAGMTLTWLFWISSDSKVEPSLNKAIFLSQWQTRTNVHNKGGSKIGYSKSAIKRHWREYNRVAHLWAAYQILNMRHEASDDAFNTLTADQSQFLAIAKAIQEFAYGFRRPRDSSRKSLLPENVWHITDDIEPAHLKKPSLPGEVINELDRYKHD